jgi:hypothetical protein
MTNTRTKRWPAESSAQAKVKEILKECIHRAHRRRTGRKPSTQLSTFSTCRFGKVCHAV